MYGLFETEFGTPMVRASERLKAVVADSAAVELLGVVDGEPLLSVERVAFTYGDKPVELRRAIYVTSNYHYQNELS
jgi:GntR family transcriptional regulator